MFALLASAITTVLIQGGLVVDGTGRPGVVQDLRIQGDRILALGHLRPRRGEILIKGTGLVVAPGFIDAHSHADGGIEREPVASSQITQGITTAVVGVDGIWSAPVGETMAKIAATYPAINFAMFSGHGGIRAKVMGQDYKRAATAAEVSKMGQLVIRDMADGALGLSSGLEYDPGYYAETEELVALSKEAKAGIYISHMRDEGNKVFDAIAEMARIRREAPIKTQISHVKLCTSPVWGRAQEVTSGLSKGYTADVYPYTFWQSSVSALTPSREWDKREIWEQALADVGGPKNVRLTNYSENAAWIGKTLEELAHEQGRDAIAIIQEILASTRGEGKKGEESVAVTAMTEPDLIAFIKSPYVMFSSDGSLGGSHPRGSGSFPRVLGRYVRDQKVISLPEAIRKMTNLPATTFGLVRRGQLKPGYFADIVVFDPKKITDRATAKNPRTLSVGVIHVYVNGQRVLKDGLPTGKRSGRMLARGR